MFREVKRSLRLIGRYFLVNLSSAIEYRSSFLIQTFGMALNNATFIFFWWVAFDKVGGLIGGYDFSDVMFIWALASSSYGLSMVVFGNVRDLNRLIVTGELDTFLLQPRPALINAAAARMQVSAWGDFLYGIALLVLTQPQTAGLWLQFALYIVTGALLIAAIQATAGTLAFYLGNASMLQQLALELTVNFTIYPESIFNLAVRVIIHTILPAAFIVHIPLALVRDFDARLFLILLAVTSAYCAFALWFFGRGLRRYESGNLIVTRM
jgi:ABC-2 type transport system permease protein